MSANRGSVRIDSGHQDPAGVEALLRSLPDWFGIEAAIAGYVDDAARLPTYRAVEGASVVGVLLLRRHFPEAAEIHVMAVHPQRHRQGIGSQLLGAAEADLRRDGVRWLQVKTLGPSKPSHAYAATRAFYAANGFQPIEEIHGLWPDNPCLLMLKSLR